MLIDTGASVSITDLPLPCTRHSIDLAGIGGNCVRAYKSLPVLVESNNAYWTQSFFICKTAEGTILGSDGMKLLKATVAYSPMALSVCDASHKRKTLPLTANNLSHTAIASVATPIVHSWDLTNKFQALCAAFPACWSVHKLDCGAAPLPPLEVTGTMPSPVKQYPIKPEAAQAVGSIIQSLLSQGVIEPCVSPCNSPIWPVQKPDGSWRLTIDYRTINAAADKLAPIVADPNTLLADIKPTHCIFSVVDIANGFWALPVAENSKAWFAFTHQNTQFTWKRMPQGFHNSPTLFHRAMAGILATVSWSQYGGTQCLQYVDDILLASSDAVSHFQALEALFTALERYDMKASPKKAQIAQDAVQYLGFTISQGSKQLTVDRRTAIATAPRPRTVRDVRKILGLFNFCRNHIPDFSVIAAPINALLKGPHRPLETVDWTRECEDAFTTLKSALTSAPALGFPCSDLPFFLWSAVKQGHMTAVLTQPHGGMQRPVAYYSSRLDSVASGLPQCLQEVQAAATAVTVSAPLVSGAPLSVNVSHAVHNILTQGRFSRVSAARWTRWEAILLAPLITLIHSPAVNPATLLPVEGDGEPHECPLSPDFSSNTEISETPLPDNDLSLFVDGSRFYNGAHPVTGYAIVDIAGQVMASGRLPSSDSAQVAELVALTHACELGSGKRLTVYTDSRYAFGVVHDFMVNWSSRGFLTSSGTPIKNGGVVQNLITASKLPDKLAVVKVKAHTKGQDAISLGNHWADEAAKAAALNDSLPTYKIATIDMSGPTDIDIAKLQNDCTKAEKWTWIENACTLNDDNIWRTQDGKVVAPQCILSLLCEVYHGPAHNGERTMRHNMSTYWWSPKMTKVMKDFIRRCIICAQCNQGPKIKVMMKHQPRPTGPFQQIQMDFIGPLPKSHGKQHCLVLIDHFTRWVEAYPVACANAATTARIIASEFCPRWGLPCYIDSDQGTHFTGKVMKQVCSYLGIKQKFHCPYHPQSSGLVERTNRTLKEKLTKVLLSKGGGWAQGLPAALMAMRATPNAVTELSPYELVTGRPMSLAPGLCKGSEDSLIVGDTLLKYCQNLNETVKNLTTQALSLQTLKDKQKEGGQEAQKYEPGKWVMIRAPHPKSFQPRWQGPHQVLLTSETALRVTGIPVWIHHSRAKPCSSPEDTTKPDDHAATDTCSLH